MRAMMKPVLGLMAAAGLAGCASMSALDQGLYNVANGVGGRDRVTGARTLSLSGRAEMVASQNAEMDQAFAAFKAKGGKLNEQVDAAGYARVQKIVGRILQVSHFADERGQWKVFLLPDPSFNAFVNGGSYVMVHKGLLDQVKSDDEVAAVIGHEIAHNAANHIGEGSAYQQLAAVSGSGSAKRGTFQASFTVNQEREADRVGILYAALAGYDPYAAVRVWERMYASEGNQVAMSDHPLNRERMAETRAVADKVKAYYMPGKVNPEAESLLVSNVLWSRQGDLVQAGKGGGLAALAETALTAYTTREGAKQTEREQLAHAQVVAGVARALQLVSREALDDSRVRVVFVYAGARPLSVLTLAAVAGDNARVVAHVPGPVQPGQQVSVTFDGREVLLGKAVESLRLGVDDAAF